MNKHLFACAVLASGCSLAVAGDNPATNTQTNPNPMNIGLSALFAAGGASVGSETISAMQGGGHDPHQIGFNLQNLELTLGGAVDPFFDAQANIVMLFDEAGDTAIEIEEAFLISKRLPAGLQLKAGQYYTEFGRHNPMHPHTWAFIDQPLIVGRTLGADGLRSQGARMAWLTPLPWYAEVIAGVQNAKGTTSDSFIGGGHEHGDEADIAADAEFERAVNGADDFLYSLRLLNGVDLTDSVSANLGFSALFGPNSASEDSSSQIYGADLYVKWLADNAQHGYPFVSWHSEYINRLMDVEETHDDEHVHAYTQKDYGWFSQVSYGFHPGWVAGLRLENVDSNAEEELAASNGQRFRTALNLTWLPTEYSKLRLQYSYDDSQYFGDVHFLWLQMEFNLGSHAAHVF